MKTFYYDIDRDWLIDSTGGKYAPTVKLAYQDYMAWRIYFATVDGGVVTVSDLSALGITQMRGAVGEDYIHDLNNGALTAGFSGAVTAITADGFSEAPPAVGIFRITNAGGDYEDVAYSAYSGTWASSATVLTFTVDATLAYVYVADNVISVEDTAPMVRITNALIDWTHLDDGYVDVTIDADTNTFEAALAGNPNKVVHFEIMGLNSSARKVLYAAWDITATNEVDPQGGRVSPGPAAKYYDKTDVDALVAGIISGGKITLTAKPTPTTTLASVDPTAAVGSFGYWEGYLYKWIAAAEVIRESPETTW